MTVNDKLRDNTPYKIKGIDEMTRLEKKNKDLITKVHLLLSIGTKY
jgi:hypothetical protein